ncbi:MAG: Gfo/Idh/MocA family oxidoreductase, partial [Hyphomicrobiaceae bacterium]|nr:Gfo/Idh/MocA family oxidoreductase [Hyphomicrobiaceae bacterium]
APWHRSLEGLLAQDRPDGMILATPNQLHVEHGLDCIAAEVPVLIEKPIAADVADGRRLVEAAERTGVPVLVGHHRRHNPLVAAARRAIAEGRLGTIVAVQASCWFYKPDGYFDVAWRRQPGAGPVFINLIHDIDTLRFLCGETETVQAMESAATRRHDVEDSAAILIRFRSGAIATVTVSDTIVAPWSWELTAAENPAYPATGEPCYRIGGTQGSLSLPDLGLWIYEGERSWWEPIRREAIAATASDPLALQLTHFLRVIRGDEAPLVSARDGLETLRVVAAVKQSAGSGALVRLD